jgi:hypothetical protein
MNPQGFFLLVIRDLEGEDGEEPGGVVLDLANAGAIRFAATSSRGLGR